MVNKLTDWQLAPRPFEPSWNKPLKKLESALHFSKMFFNFVEGGH